jgi:hypothetical protein
MNLVLTNSVSHLSICVSISLPYRTLQDRPGKMVRLTITRHGACATSERADIQSFWNTDSATTVAAKVPSIRCALRPSTASACPRQDLTRCATSTKQNTRSKTTDSLHRARRFHIQAFCVPREWRSPSSRFPPISTTQSVPRRCFL